MFDNMEKYHDKPKKQEYSRLVDLDSIRGTYCYQELKQLGLTDYQIKAKIKKEIIRPMNRGSFPDKALPKGWKINQRMMD